MILFPCCKINLGLNVVGKRPDGYHDIETVFYPVPLCDALEVTEMDAQFPSPYDCDLKVTGNAVDCDEQKNLVVKAYHLLRQHAYVNFHRPVVIATPKSMLRNKLAVSMPQDFTSGKWEPVLDDPAITDPSKVERLLICSGKVRWDLVAERAKRGLESQVAIVSLERLYPLPIEDLVAELRRYPDVTDVRFVQDEPLNQGAWPFMALHLPAAVDEAMGGGYHLDLTVVARPEASSPSVGLHKVHVAQEADLLQRAFEGA